MFNRAIFRSYFQGRPVTFGNCCSRIFHTPDVLLVTQQHQSNEQPKVSFKQRFSLNELLPVMRGTIYDLTLLVVIVSMFLNGVLNMSILVCSSNATSNFVYYCFSPGLVLRWLVGAMVTVSDLWSSGHGFDSQSGHYQVTTLGKLFTPMCLCHQAV